METITHNKASQLLGINPRTLTRLVAEHEIQFTRKGNAKLYKLSDIEKLDGVKKDDITVKIFAVCSPKGGTGKTTTIKYVSHILAQRGFKVLVVDCDPQHYYSEYAQNYLDDEQVAKLKNNNLLTLLKKEKSLNSVTFPVADNIDFIAGVRKLEHYEKEFSDTMASELLLKQALSPALSRYDYILIDTSPAQSQITVASVFSSHAIIIPIIPDVDSIDASVDLVQTINKIKGSGISDKFKLTTLYILPTKQKTGFNSKFQKTVLTDIQETYQNNGYLDIDIEVLQPVKEYSFIPQESYDGTLKINTPAYKDYDNAFKEVF